MSGIQHKIGLFLILNAFLAVGQDLADAQGPVGPPPAPARPAEAPAPPVPPQAPQPPLRHRPPLERAFHVGGPGKWWHDPGLAHRLGLTEDQQKKMDDIFQQNRVRLIDLNASLQKEEAIMEPLVEADQPDESKILAQIDKVAQARAELEKANARMLLGIRRVLNQDQWKKLQEEQRERETQAPRPPRPARVPQR
jgi:Spy/CpxP family protein refolding chaperone